MNLTTSEEYDRLCSEEENMGLLYDLTPKTMPALSTAMPGIPPCLALWILKAVNGGERAPKANPTHFKILPILEYVSSSLTFSQF